MVGAARTSLSYYYTASFFFALRARMLMVDVLPYLAMAGKFLLKEFQGGGAGRVGCHHLTALRIFDVHAPI